VGSKIGVKHIESSYKKQETKADTRQEQT